MIFSCLRINSNRAEILKSIPFLSSIKYKNDSLCLYTLYRNDHYFSRSTSFRQLHSQDATNTRFVAPCISIDHGGDGIELWWPQKFSSLLCSLILWHSPLFYYASYGSLWSKAWNYVNFWQYFMTYCKLKLMLLFY